MTNVHLRVMVIGAHPDDCELRAGGIALKYRSAGHEVQLVSVTTGDTGHHEQAGGVLARRRAEEARRAAELAGISSKVLDIPSNQLIPDLASRAKLITTIREFSPDVIITHRPHDYHPDHRYTAQLVQDSAYAVMVPSVLPLTKSMKSQPVIAHMYDHFTRPIPFAPDVVVAIDEVQEQKCQMIHCHESQLYEWLPWIDGMLDQVPATEEDRLQWLTSRMLKRDGRVADQFRAELLGRYGDERGRTVICAEAFEIGEYGARPAKRDLDRYFPL